MIAPSRWSLRTDLPHPTPHRAAAPRATPTLHLEWHVGGVKAHEGCIWPGATWADYTNESDTITHIVDFRTDEVIWRRQ